VVIHDGIEILYANRAAVEGFGAVAEGPVVGRSIWDFIPEPYRSLLQEQVARMLDSGQTAETIEIPVRLADGSDRWTEIDASPTRYGGRAAIAATLRDVTERRRAERAAHESRARHQELFEAVPIGLYRSTLDGRFLAVNPALVMMLGYPDRDSLLRIDVRSLYVDPEDRVALLEAARSQDIVRGFEARLQTPDGEVRRVRIDAQLRCDDDGQPAYLEGSIEDVTARREAEEEARLNQQRLDRAVAASGLGLWEWDIPTGSVEVDDRWFTMLGYEPGAFPLDIDRWLDMVHPDDQATAWKALQRHLAGLEDSYRVELRLRTVDGGWRWVADRGQVVARDEGDGPLRVAGTHTDIQARKEAAEALRRSEERLAGIIRAAPLGITVSRLHTGEFVEVNETFARMLGYERDELLGRSSIDMGLWVDAGDRERLRNELIAEDRTRGFPVRFRTRDGDTRTVELSTELITVDGETCALALHQDVTDSRLLEEQLRQAQKMEAVGRLAGGVAHDFNNLLTAITGHVEFLLDDLDQDDPRRTDAYEIREGADRARRLTRQLLAFSRQQVLNPRRVDLSDVVASFEGLLRRLIGEDIDLRVIRHEPCLVRVDPSQLEQVVLNLAVNARDAMPDGGALTLETGCSDLSDPGEAGFPPGLRPGQYATLHVTDSGSGMDGDTRARIFEPFFTTKPAGKGTGLGLSTVYGIISQSGGHIEVDSEPGDGTTFSIYLPLVDGEPDPIARPTPAARIASPESGTKVVLLVEDEDAVRALAKRVLERSSYRVLSAGDGNAALRMVDNHGIPDLLLTDMVMPGMGGRELAQQLHERAPDLPVIFMSGYSEDMLGSARSHANFLEKPFTPNDLTDALRSALEPEPHP
jgi:PAS domain S-box-containing protein